MDETANTPVRKAGKPPITASPAFPWIVALWFAALLGIGSLILPSTMLERIVVATGLSAALPMTAPPLGFTAKALLALVGMVAGGSLGLFFARRIAAPKGERTQGKRKGKPLIAARTIDDDDHDDLPARTSASRRRVLAIEEEQGTSDFLNVAPLPGVNEEVRGPILAERRKEPEDIVEEGDLPTEVAGDVEPFELEELAALPDDVREGVDESEPQEFMPVTHSSGPEIAVDYSEPAEARATAAEPLPFSPPSMASAQDEQNSEQGGREDAADSAPESEDIVSEEQIFQAAHAPGFDTDDAAGFDAGPDVAMDAEIEADAVGSDDESEGLMQLVQRLGSTLEKHRVWVAANAARVAAEAPAPEAEACEPDGDAADAPFAGSSATEAPIPDQFDPAEAKDVSQAMAAYFGAAAASTRSEPQVSEELDTADEQEPAETSEQPDTETARTRYETFRGTLAAFDVEDEDDADEDLSELTASFTLPILKEERSAPIPRPAFDQAPPYAHADETAADADDDEEDEAFDGSAVISPNPFKGNADEFVRVEEPEPEDGDAQPAVLFPNQQARKPSAVESPAPSRAFDPPAGQDAGISQRSHHPRPSNDDNERALREALMNLQRMGK